MLQSKTPTWSLRRLPGQSPFSLHPYQDGSLFPRYLKNSLKNKIHKKIKNKMKIGSPRNPLWAGLVSKASLLREVVRESRVKGWGCPHPTRIITSTLLKEMGMPTSILLKEIWLPPKTARKQFQKSFNNSSKNSSKNNS